jgi:hypothetical protein
LLQQHLFLFLEISAFLVFRWFFAFPYFSSSFVVAWLYLEPWSSFSFSVAVAVSPCRHQDPLEGLRGAGSGVDPLPRTSSAPPRALAS